RSFPGIPGTAPGVPAGSERNVWVPIREKRNWINGASLSFPVNALTGMFVGSDNPLYYLYTTFRAEFAYARSVGLRQEFHDGEAGVAFQRFLSVPLANAGVTSSPFLNSAFLPGGQYASEGTCQREDGTGIRGCRRGHMASRDVWAFAIGLDHNQWIRWLNPSNSFTISAQIFKADVIGLKNHFNTNKPAGLDNDAFHGPSPRPRNAAPTGPTTNPAKLNRPGGPGNRANVCIPVSGPNPPCQFSGLLPFPQATEA